MIQGFCNFLQPFQIKDIVQAKWKQLTKEVKDNNFPIYWLSNIPAKNAERAKITLLIDMSTSYTQNGYTIISARYNYGDEKLDKTFIETAYAENLGFYLIPNNYRLHVKRAKAGRPKEYNDSMAKMMLTMRTQGMTLREIAEKYQTSTTQVQRMLNKVQTKEQRAAKATYVREKRKRDKGVLPKKSPNAHNEQTQLLNQLTSQISDALKNL